MNFVTKSKFLTNVRGFTKKIGLNRLVCCIMDYCHSPSRNASHSHFKEIYEAHTSDINTVLDWLADERSKEVLRNVIGYKKTRDRKYLKGIIELKNQYFPHAADGSDIFDFNNETFVDCGAYTGDTIKALFKKAKTEVSAIVAFEPDKYNFDVLEKFAERKKELSITLYNAGVYDKNGTVSFSGNASVESGISDEGLQKIKVMAIDGCPECFNATFIKMDVEGAELAALHGARETIKKNKPKLAICIYHNPEDLWTIPAFIRDINPNYKLYIRHHLYTFCETVLYAIDEFELTNLN